MLAGILLAALTACRDTAPVPTVARPADVAAQRTLGERATVLLFLAVDCPIANSYAPELRRIRDDYAARGVAFRRVYPGPGVTAADLDAHGRDFALGMPPVLDPEGLLARDVGAAVTPEAAVCGPDGELLYRGRIDDLYVDYGKRRREPSRRDLRLALDQVLGGRPVEVPRTTAVGCLLGVPEPTGEPSPTFADTIASLVHTHCTPCHRDGGSGPFPLVTHAQVAARAEQIGRVTRSRYMPPWKPAPGFGAFVGERRMPDADLDALQRWIAAGAPEGDPDRVSPPPTFPGAWALGEPDVVLELDAPYEVPEEGIDVWRCFVLPTGLDDGRRVSAVEILPTAPRVVHHVLLYPDVTGAARAADAADPAPGYAGMFSAGFSAHEEIAGWVRGVTPRRLPDGLSWSLPAGADVVLDAHFQPSGRPESVSFRVGLHLTDEPPARELAFVRLGAAAINILPGTADYTVRDAFVLPVDVRAVGIVPHAHFVCADVRCEAVTPDGRRVPLVHIPDWDFDWHDLYRYADPVPLPAGTRVEMTMRFDNSADNPRNPVHPPRRVLGGPGALEEMSAVWIQVTVDDTADADALRRAMDAAREAPAIREDLRLSTLWAHLADAHDTDGDGTLDPAEERAVERFLAGFDDREAVRSRVIDADGDGVLSSDERRLLERFRAFGRDGR